MGIRVVEQIGSLMKTCSDQCKSNRLLLERNAIE